MLLTDFRNAPARYARYNGTYDYVVASMLGRVNFGTLRWRQRPGGITAIPTEGFPRS